MSKTELKKKLINKINETENQTILEEAYRLFEIETEDLEIYKLKSDQKKVVEEARSQIKKGKYLTNDQANEDIDKWLNK